MFGSENETDEKKFEQKEMLFFKRKTVNKCNRKPKKIQHKKLKIILKRV